MESFGKLKFVGEDLMVCNTKLVDIGALDEVGGEIGCAESPLKKEDFDYVLAKDVWDEFE